MSVAGRTRRGPTVTSYHVQLSDGRQEFTVIADAEVFCPTGFARVYGSEGLRFGSLRARPTAGINRRVDSGRRLLNEFVDETQCNGRHGGERSVTASTGAPL